MSRAKWVSPPVSYTLSVEEEAGWGADAQLREKIIAQLTKKAGNRGDEFALVLGPSSWTGNKPGDGDYVPGLVIEVVVVSVPEFRDGRRLSPARQAEEIETFRRRFPVGKPYSMERT